MAGCYECNYCGKCTMVEVPISNLTLVCIDCGHEVQPGEDSTCCAKCGSNAITYREDDPQ